MFWLYFEGELEAAVSELADSNCQLATLKAESDAAKGAVFPVLNFGNKHVDRVRDKQKDLIYGVYPQGANGPSFESFNGHKRPS
ncbi:hypothetical protein CerSpe_169640 [Prunus speciosa]